MEGGHSRRLPIPGSVLLVLVFLFIRETDETKKGDSTRKKEPEKNLKALVGSVLGDNRRVGELVILDGDGSGAVFVGRSKCGEGCGLTG